MAKLTLKQESFCQAYIETGNASEAYRRSYDALKMNDATIHNEAYRLLKNPDVAIRVKKLIQELDELALVSKREHLDRLKHLSEKAETANQFNAAITAEVNRGKVAGLYIDKQEITGAGGGAIQVEMDTTITPSDAYKKMLGKQ